MSVCNHKKVLALIPTLSRLPDPVGSVCRSESLFESLHAILVNFMPVSNIMISCKINHLNLPSKQLDKNQKSRLLTNSAIVQDISENEAITLDSNVEFTLIDMLRTENVAHDHDVCWLQKSFDVVHDMVHVDIVDDQIDDSYAASVRTFWKLPTYQIDAVPYQPYHKRLSPSIWGSPTRAIRAKAAGSACAPFR